MMDLKKRWVLGNVGFFTLIIIVILLGFLYSKIVLYTGIIMLVVQGLVFFKEKKNYQNEEKLKEYENLQKDERNKFIEQKSSAWTFMTSLIVKVILMLSFFLFGEKEVAMIFTYLVCGESLFFSIALHIARKRY